MVLGLIDQNNVICFRDCSSCLKHPLLYGPYHCCFTSFLDAKTSDVPDFTFRQLLPRVSRFSALPLLTMPQSLTLPPAPIFESDDVSDSGSANQVQRFPHTRAQLLAIFRQHRGSSDSFDGDGDGDESSRISTSLVTKVAGLLANEQEDEVKALLKTTWGVEDDMVCS